MKRRSGLWSVSLLVAVLVVAFAGFTAFAKTPAGEMISNQARADYTDTGGVPRTALSNVVYVTVQQVAGVEVTPKDMQTVQVTPNLVVQFPFRVINTGNGPDSFELVAEALTNAGDPNLLDTAVEVFHDVNGNGVIDSGEVSVTTIGPIASGASAALIARFRVPPGATIDDRVEILLEATSEHTSTETAFSGIIIFDVVTAGVLSSRLESDVENVDPDGEITYTVFSTNQGMQPIAHGVGKVTLVIPEGTEFEPGSLYVNGVKQDDPLTPDGHEVPLPTVNPGQTAVVSYTVTLTDPSVRTIANQVPVQVDANPAVKTNPVSTKVNHEPGSP